MKQVIIRIRDCRPTYFKTVAKKYCYSVASFEYDGMDFIKSNLLPGREVYIKVGNQYAFYLSYEELEDYAKECDLDMDMALYNRINNYSTLYYVKEYLPTY